MDHAKGAAEDERELRTRIDRDPESCGLHAVMMGVVNELGLIRSLDMLLAFRDGAVAVWTRVNAPSPSSAPRPARRAT